MAKVFLNVCGSVPQSPGWLTPAQVLAGRTSQPRTVISSAPADFPNEPHLIVGAGGRNLAVTSLEGFEVYAGPADGDPASECVTSLAGRLVIGVHEGDVVFVRQLEV